MFGPLRYCDACVLKEIKDKTAINVANVVEQTWLTRYPWPTQIIYDKGTEFMAEFAKMIKDDYGIRKSPASVRNPQANSILERIHQIIGNVIQTFKFDEKYMDKVFYLQKYFARKNCVKKENQVKFLVQISFVRKQLMSENNFWLKIFLGKNFKKH